MAVLSTVLPATRVVLPKAARRQTTALTTDLHLRAVAAVPTVRPAAAVHPTVPVLLVAQDTPTVAVPAAGTLAADTLVADMQREDGNLTMKNKK